MQILASQCLACCTSGKGTWFSNNTTGIAAFMLLFLEITWPSKSGFYAQKSGYCGPSVIHHIQGASPSSHSNNLRLYSPGTASELWLSLENEWISPGQRTGRKIWKTEKERATTDSWREQREKQRYGRFNTRVGIHMKAWANACSAWITTAVNRVSSTVRHLPNRCGVKAFCPQVFSKSWIIY